MYQAYANDPQMRINGGIRRRLAPLMENSRRRIELMNSLLFSLPGTPVIYYGDEIGMGDNIYLGDRNGVRTPMQWTGDRNGGFSRADAARLYAPLITDPVYGFSAVNVEAQERAPFSLLNWMKRLIGLRKQHTVFGRGAHRVRAVAEPQGAGVRAPRRDRHDALRRQPVAQRAAGRARPVALPRHGAGRDARAKRVSTHRRPALLPEPRRLRLQLVPPAAGGAGDHRADDAGDGGRRAGASRRSLSARCGTRCSTARSARSSSATCSVSFSTASRGSRGRGRARRASRTGACSAAAPNRSSSPSSKPSSRMRRRDRGHGVAAVLRSARALVGREREGGAGAVSRTPSSRASPAPERRHLRRVARRPLRATSCSKPRDERRRHRYAGRALPPASRDIAPDAGRGGSDALQTALAADDDGRRRDHVRQTPGRSSCSAASSQACTRKSRSPSTWPTSGSRACRSSRRCRATRESGEPSSSIGMFTLPRQSVESQADGWTHAMEWLSRLFDQVAARDLPAGRSDAARLPATARPRRSANLMSDVSGDCGDDRPPHRRDASRARRRIDRPALCARAARPRGSRSPRPARPGACRSERSAPRSGARSDAASRAGRRGWRARERCSRRGAASSTRSARRPPRHDRDEDPDSRRLSAGPGAAGRGRRLHSERRRTSRRGRRRPSAKSNRR